MWIPPVGKLRNSVCPVAALGSLSSQALSTGNISPWGHSPTQAAGTCCCMLTEIHVHTAGTPLVPSNEPPTVFTFYTHLAPRPLHLTYRLVWLDLYSVTYSLACPHTLLMLAPQTHGPPSPGPTPADGTWFHSFWSLQPLAPRHMCPPVTAQLLVPRPTLILVAGITDMQALQPMVQLLALIHTHACVHWKGSVLSRKSNRTE